MRKSLLRYGEAGEYTAPPDRVNEKYLNCGRYLMSGLLRLELKLLTTDGRVEHGAGIIH